MQLRSPSTLSAQGKAWTLEEDLSLKNKLWFAGLVKAATICRLLNQGRQLSYQSQQISWGVVTRRAAATEGVMSDCMGTMALPGELSRGSMWLLWPECDQMRFRVTLPTC